MHRFLLLFLLITTQIFSLSQRGHHSSHYPDPSYTHELAIGAIFRDDAPYLKEWIEFHRLVGVEHFYLYNNLSRDNYLEVLKPYIEQKIVTLIQWPFKIDAFPNRWPGIQQTAYTHCINRTRNTTKWIAFIDTDEFLFPVQQDSLTAFLKEYEQFGGVTANWVVFGTSYENKIPPNQLMIEKLYLCETQKGSPYVKSIVRPERVEKCLDAHFFAYKEGFFQVASNKEQFAGARFPECPLDQIRINHYWSRDEFFYTQIKVPRKNKMKNYSLDVEEERRKLNQEEDRTIFRFIPALKKRMGFLDAPQ